MRSRLAWSGAPRMARSSAACTVSSSERGLAAVSIAWGTSSGATQEQAVQHAVRVALLLDHKPGVLEQATDAVRVPPRPAHEAAVRARQHPVGEREEDA